MELPGWPARIRVLFPPKMDALEYVIRNHAHSLETCVPDGQAPIDLRLGWTVLERGGTEDWGVFDGPSAIADCLVKKLKNQEYPYSRFDVDFVGIQIEVGRRAAP